MPKTMGLLGKKVGMSRMYSEHGEVIPVTVIETGPCVVLQKKTVGQSKPMAGHLKAAAKGGFYHIREFRVKDPAQYEIGQEIVITDLFKAGDLVDIQSTTKGRGFQGVVRRYGFKGGRATHGSMFHRAPGSIGCSAWPSRVIKGKRLPGHMGTNMVTKKNCMVIDVRPEQNIVIIKGGVPGAKQGLVQIYTK